MIQALNKYEITGNGDEWKKKFVMLSTWNEYGEGTYMMPAGLNGFGYLDTVRKVFTKGTNHTDEQPNTLQMARLGHMYPINREIIRPQGYYEAPEASTVIYEEKFAENGTALWGSGNCTVSADGDILTGTASNTDPILYRSRHFAEVQGERKSSRSRFGWTVRSATTLRFTS